MINISFIICTYNRSKILSKTLDNLISKINKLQSRNCYNCEIIVVDNNSCDSTKKTVKLYIKKYSSITIKYFFEKEQGITYARNLGVSKSKYQWLAFIDDDIILSDNWLSTFNKLVNKYPKVKIFGGKIQPLNNLPTNVLWLSYLIKHYDIGHFWPLGLIDQGNNNKFLTYPDIGIGNVVVNRKLFSKLGKFREPFGTCKPFVKIIGGEDIDFIERAIEKNIKIIYSPKLLCFHNILLSKISKKYLRWRFFEHGKAIALFNVLHRGGYKKELKNLLRNFILNLRRTISGNLLHRQTNFYYEINLFYTLGYFKSCIFFRLNIFKLPKN